MHGKEGYKDKNEKESHEDQCGIQVQYKESNIELPRPQNLLFEKKTHSQVQGQIISRLKCVLAFYNILEPKNLLWTNL